MMTERAPVTLDGILRAAIELADEGGIGTLSMRRIAARMGVQAMSLYHHVAGKEQILDGLVDRVFAEIALPDSGRDWRAEMRWRAISTREVLTRHPWAVPLLDSRTSPGPATLRHHDATLACLRAGGLTLEMAAHAMAVLDSYVRGFMLQITGEVSLEGPELAEMTQAILDTFPAEEFPHLFELARTQVLQPGYSFANGFDFGLQAVLDGVAGAADADGAGLRSASPS